MHLQLTLGQGVDQVLFQRAAIGRGVEQIVRKEAEPAAARPFCRVKRKVGIADQFLAILPVERGDGDTHRCTDDTPVAADGIGFAQFRDNIARQIAQRSAVVTIGQNDLKFVAAQPADPVLVPNRMDQPLGHLLQQGIAHRVAQRVIHGLEPVKVDHHDGTAAPLRFERGQRLVEQLAHWKAVEQSRQGIIFGQAAAFLHSFTLCRDIGAEPPKAGKITLGIMLRNAGNGPPGRCIIPRRTHDRLIKLRLAGHQEWQCALLPVVGCALHREQADKGLARRLACHAHPVGRAVRKIGDTAVAVGGPEPPLSRGLVVAQQQQRLAIIMAGIVNRAGRFWHRGRAPAPGQPARDVICC